MTADYRLARDRTGNSMAKKENIFTSVIDAIRIHVDAGNVSVKQLAFWCGRDDRTIYNWVAGQSGPSSLEVALWLQRLPEAVKLDVAAAQLAGSGLVVSLSECEGKQSLSLAVESAVSATRSAAALVQEVVAATSDGVLTKDEASQITSTVNAAKADLDRVSQVARCNSALRIAR